jgi:hypothetical protein
MNFQIEFNRVFKQSYGRAWIVGNEFFLSKAKNKSYNESFAEIIKNSIGLSNTFSCINR